MKLIDVVETIFDQNDDQTIWVKAGSNVTPETEVILAFKGDANKTNGYQSFLEVFNVQDLIASLVGRQEILDNELLIITNLVIDYVEKSRG